MMLLTFLEAKKILLHRDRFPNKALKLRLRFLSLSGRLLKIVSDSELEHEQSNRTDFLTPCLGQGTRVGDEEEFRREEALKRCRFGGVVQGENNINGLHNEEDEDEDEEEEEESLIGGEVDEDHEQALTDWEAMVQSSDLRESIHSLQEC